MSGHAYPPGVTGAALGIVAGIARAFGVSSDGGLRSRFSSKAAIPDYLPARPL